MNPVEVQTAIELARTPVSVDIVAVWALAGVAAAGALFAVARRRRSGWKLDASLLAVGIAGGWLFWSSTQPEAEYYKFVHEVVAGGPALVGKRLQVHGVVACDSLMQRQGSLTYRFDLESTYYRPHAKLAAEYNGVLPDLFREGTEVIANGRLGDDGRLHVAPDGLLAKCPSKYDGPPPGPPSCFPRVAPAGPW